MAEKETKAAAVEPNKKPEKAKKEKKGRLKNGWKGFKSEVKKVTWPSWKQVLKGTGVVLLVVLVCAIALGGLDTAFTWGMKQLFELFK